MKPPGNSTHTCKQGVIDDLRLQHGLTVEALAATARVSVRTLYRVMKGNPAHLDTIARIATALGTTSATLLERSSFLPLVPTSEVTRYTLRMCVTGTAHTAAQARSVVQAGPAAANHLSTSGASVDSYQCEISTGPDPALQHRAIVCVWVRMAHGGPAWVIVAIRLEALGDFLMAEVAGRLDIYHIEPFGEVICSSEGTIPPDEVITRVASMYRADPHQLRLRTLTRPDLFSATPGMTTLPSPQNRQITIEQEP